ncbi:hypothetical protein [Succinivibrio dextrinosolvens]|uniref:hypothetical protein n=1 Tax=Succinivibrio dextrinosolvens TaxID=83771 RepID=UPI00094420F1|nr:hypothetical protein [Succinivibrio dextrinosolvens]
MLGPNITGSSSDFYQFIDAIDSGALRNELTRSATNGTVTSDFGAHTLYFDAKSSNSIYTDSGKVYPLSLALNFIIKA